MRPTRPPATRREALRLAAALAAAGLLPPAAQAAWSQAAFAAKNVPDVLKALGTALPAASPLVQLTAAEVAENGAAVPMTLACTAPGVKRLALMVEKNPTALIVVFDVGDAVEPSIATRIKMAESSPVHLLAVLADGRVLFTRREVKVTLGGCG